MNMNTLTLCFFKVGKFTISSILLSPSGSKRTRASSTLNCSGTLSSFPVLLPISTTFSLNSAGLTTSYGSGQTYTPVIGKVHQTSAEAYGSLENSYSNFGNIFGAKNSSRYPSYFRIDISLARKMNVFGINSELKFQIVKKKIIIYLFIFINADI